MVVPDGPVEIEFVSSAPQPSQPSVKLEFLADGRVKGNTDRDTEVPDACEALPGELEFAPFCFVPVDTPRTGELMAALYSAGLRSCESP